MSSSPALAADALRVSGAEIVWPDTAQARTLLLTQLDELNQALLANDSATATLQAWCDAQGPGPAIRAVRLDGAVPATPADVLEALAAAPDEAVRYRRVRLMRGERQLSEAENWYRPSLLSAEMNRRLDETDTPFGVVAAELGYRRETLAAEVLADAGTRADGSGRMILPATLMRHRARLALPDGRPFSLVVESYSPGVLAAPPRD